MSYINPYCITDYFFSNLGKLGTPRDKKEK